MNKLEATKELCELIKETQSKIFNSKNTDEAEQIEKELLGKVEAIALAAGIEYLAFSLSIDNTDTEYGDYIDTLHTKHKLNMLNGKPSWYASSGCICADELTVEDQSFYQLLKDNTNA